MVVKHGRSSLADPDKKDPDFGKQVPEETFLPLRLGAQDQQLVAEQDQPPCGASQDTGTRTVRARHTPQQLLVNHLSMHLRKWATPLSAQDELDGYHQRMNISAHAGTVHNGLLQKRLERISAESSIMFP